MKDTFASGKRKRARAKAVLKKGTGKVTINSVELDEYKPYYDMLKIKEPLLIASDDSEKVDIKVKVEGGGLSSQAEASRLVIARALAKANTELKEKFLNYDRNLLVADVRNRETRKPNTQGKARSKRQKSYR
ncbi:MAG: 30S ribosomal protein S9 [Nanobdellota archaeon]